MLLRITSEGKTYLTKKTPEEEFLALTFPLPIESLSTAQHKIADELRKRKEFLSIQDHKKVTISLTPLGKKLQQ